MTLLLTPEMLAAAYEYLRATAPFKRWKLPHASSVKFKVSKAKDYFGQYRWDGKQHTIEISSAAIAHTDTLMVYMSHEMVHLYLEENGLEARGSNTHTHNEEFKKRAKQVCRIHGFDQKAFH